MKRQLISATLLLSLLPAVVLAVQPDQCALNSTCSFSIRGKFNKVIRTPNLQIGQTYKCTVKQGDGYVISIKNVYASKGVTYQIKGRRFNKPFIIHGPGKGSGYVQYTLYNHNDPWNTDSLQYQCKTVNP